MAGGDGMRTHGLVELIGERVCSILTSSDMCYDSSMLFLFGIGTIVLFVGGLAGAILVPKG
jgi:hypothetical protein